VSAITPRVVHVVPPGGGGVERCVRDIASRRPGDVILHVSDAQWVLEQPATACFTPLAPNHLLRWAARGGLGAPLVMHAHSTVAVVRQACANLAAATDAPRVITLHDIWFADAKVGTEELTARLAFVRSAVQRCAPSHFIVERARQMLGDDASCRWVPLGSSAPDLPDTLALSQAAHDARGSEGFAIAVIGAIGAHKGLAALEAVAPLMPGRTRIVVLGYTERQLRQGWTASGRIWVHGMFDPGQLPLLVRHYGARLAWFPPGMPESHCYALSDAWLSGLEALVPDHGALAERVRRHGGGALYDPHLDTGSLAARIAEALRTAQRHHGSVPLQPPLPTLDEMMETMNSLYERLPANGVARAPDDDGVQALAQRHLDSTFMRREVTDLARELETAWQRVAVLEQRVAEAERQLVQVTHEGDHAHAQHVRLRQGLRSLVRWLPNGLQARLGAVARRWLDGRR
jgi:glycosyltransferase involved in cell wall biosynthesis